MSEQPLAPAPMFPERAPNEYQYKVGESITGNQGPVRFEEGLASDQDVPNDFVTGIVNGYATDPGRPNRNAPVWVKPAQETMRERAHAGSASWIEAPTMLNEFVQGSFTDYAEPRFEESIRNGARQQRPAPTIVND